MDNGALEDVTEDKSNTNIQSNQYDGLEDEDFNPLREVFGESFYEDEDSSEDEGMPDYKIGGYRPIKKSIIIKMNTALDPPPWRSNRLPLSLFEVFFLCES